MKKIVYLFSLSTLVFCLLLIVPSFTSKHNDEIVVAWPSAIDSEDQHMINLVRHRRQADEDGGGESEGFLDLSTTPPETPETSDPATSPQGTSPTTPSTTAASEAPEEAQPSESSESDISATPAPAKSNSTKNFTIDWNEVEKKWQATLPEEEVGKKWQEMETGLKNGVRSLLRTIFPQIVSMSSDAKVSGNCSAGILKWIISLRHLKGWAVKSESGIRSICAPPALSFLFFHFSLFASLHSLSHSRVTQIKYDNLVGDDDLHSYER
jgi:hypothetical protein